MATKLRLKRMGRKKRPFYRVVVADSRCPRDGRIVESVGWYDPAASPALVQLNTDRVLYWLGTGAQPSDTVKNLFREQGILLRRHLQAQGMENEHISMAVEKFQSDRKDRRKKQDEKKARKKAEAKTPAVQETGDAAAGAADTQNAPEAGS